MKNIPVRHIAATHKEPVLSGSFSIRDLHDLLAGKDMFQELHRHDFFYILALKKGKGNHEIDFTSYKVGDNSIFIMRPGQVHQLTLDAASTGYLLAFKTDFYSPHDRASIQLLRKASSINLYQPGTNNLKILFALLTRIFREYTEKQDGYQYIIKANLDILFIELARQNSQSLPKKNNPYTQERLGEFLEYLETHVAEHKQASHYAHRMNLSLHQLNSITKTMLGKTCSELISEYIILEAKRYLLATPGQVKEIAWHLGYEDVSYFIRFFKKHTGYTPDVFRQNSR